MDCVHIPIGVLDVPLAMKLFKYNYNNYYHI